MAKKQFQPIAGDLERLNEAERLQYVLAACDYLGVPPELGLVKLCYMDSGDAKRNLVLYVEKGATDIIRDKRGIDTDSMEETNGSGYVGWKVKGHDKTGRHEMAVGTVTTSGKTGKAAADAVMVAQTKALRRMTLQFAGGGFLDSTELNESTTDIANSSLSLAQMGAQPVTAPNAEAGKDITETVPGFTPTAPLKVGDKIIVNGKEETVVEVIGAGKARKPRGRRPKVSLDAQLSDVRPATVADATAPVAEQKPGEVEAAAPVQPSIPASEISNAVVPVTEIVPVPAQPANAAPAAEPPTDGSPKPTDEQLKGYMRRLSEYLNDILPRGGFTQSEGLSRNAKMGQFFKKMFPKANTKNLSAAQWETFYTYMDGNLKSQGAEKLVGLIEAQIKS